MTRHRTVVLLCAASLVLATTACTTTRIVADRFVAPPALPGALDQLVAPDDQVVVTTMDGTRIALTVTAAGADVLEGQVEPAGEVTRLPIERIARIERREKDRVKTTVLVLGIIVCVIVVLQAIASLSFGRGMAL